MTVSELDAVEALVDDDVDTIGWEPTGERRQPDTDPWGGDGSTGESHG